MCRVSPPAPQSWLAKPFDSLTTAFRAGKLTLSHEEICRAVVFARLRHGADGLQKQVVRSALTSAQVSHSQGKAAATPSNAGARVPQRYACLSTELNQRTPA